MKFIDSSKNLNGNIIDVSLIDGTRAYTGVVRYDTNKVFVDDKDLVAKKYVDDKFVPGNITLNRDGNGNIESIEYEAKPTLNIIRDLDGNITSYNNGIYNWVIEKTGETITGITVTTI